MAELADQIASAIRALSITQRSDADAWVRGSELTRQQAVSLGFIGDRQACGVIARDLAESTGTTPASVTSLLKGLEERGLVTRTPSPDDSRIKLLTVTPKGAQLVEGFEEHVRASQARRLSALTTSEQEQLLALLSRVTADIDRSTPSSSDKDGHA